MSDRRYLPRTEAVFKVSYTGEEAWILCNQLEHELETAKAIILTYQQLARNAQVALQPVMEQLARSLPPEAMR